MPVSFYVKQFLMALTDRGTPVFFFFIVVLTQHFSTETLILVALEISTDSFLPNSTVISSIEDTNFIFTRKSFFLTLKNLTGEWQGLEMSPESLPFSSTVDCIYSLPVIRCTADTVLISGMWEVTCFRSGVGASFSSMPPPVHSHQQKCRRGWHPAVTVKMMKMFGEFFGSETHRWTDLDRWPGSFSLGLVSETEAHVRFMRFPCYWAHLSQSQAFTGSFRLPSAAALLLRKFLSFANFVLMLAPLYHSRLFFLAFHLHTQNCSFDAKLP